jgi:flagellar motor protein MotB
VQEHGSDGLNSALTDLMTSLMVIFILLLLVFLNRTAGRDPAMTDVLLAKLRTDLVPQGFSDELIQIDKKDRNAILVIVPGRLMNFELGQFALRPDGEQFLRDKIPPIAGVLCGDEFRSVVESIIVEGHTDANSYRTSSAEESQNLNLKLSQDRSMEVVKKSLAYLTDRPAQRECFLQKLSATGRGEQDLQPTDEESRRVIFRIRVRADKAEQIGRKVQ